MVAKSNGRTDSQVEAKDLFAKLSSLKEESYKQFSNMIDCYSSNISDGIRDLTDKVSDLQSELSLIRKEKSVLLETVDNLNGEIRQLNAKLQSLTQPEEEPNLELTKEEILDGEDSFEATEIHQMTNETRTSKSIDEDYDPLTDPEIQEQSNIPNNLQGDNLTESSFYEEIVGDVDEDNIEEIYQKESKARYKCVCPECGTEFSTDESLQIHKKTVHLKLKGDHPKSGAVKDHSKTMRLKVRTRRGNIKISKFNDGKHVCGDCGYSTTLKDVLRNHKASVHNNIEDKIQCEMCPFATPRKRNLKYHMETIHKIGEGRFKCEYCPYTSSHVGNFRYHIKRKHEKVKKIRLLKD